MSDGSPRLPIPRVAFVTLSLASLATLNGVVWWRLVRGAGLGPWGDAVGGAVLVAGIALTLGALLARVTRMPLPGWVSPIGLGWLGLVFLAFSATVATEPLRWLLPLGGVEVGPWLSQVTFGGLGVAVAWGYRAARWPVVERVRVPVTGLDPALSGFRIVQLSDVHVDDAMDPAWLEEIVARANALEPDLVAITGDLVDGPVDALAGKVAALGRLRSTHGTFFVTGNHEYYAGAPAWIRHLGDLGIRVLRNEHVVVEEDGASFTLAGVDDLFGRRLEPGHGPDLDRALAGRDPGQPVVLLSHQPVTIDEAARRGVALQLSGHTHGGQIFPFHVLVRLVQPYLSGLVRHGDTALYVHRGTGHWGPPLRIGAPAEIAALELVPG